MSKFKVYTLTDPRDNSIRYVGMAEDAFRRFATHLCLYSKKTLPKDDWIKELKSLDLVPIMTIIDGDDTVDEARQREEYWIEKFRAEGAPLTNTYIPVYPVHSLDQVRPVICDSEEDIAKSQFEWQVRDLAKSLGGRLIGRWDWDSRKRIAHIWSLSPGKNHISSLGIEVSDLIYLPHDEIVERIKQGIAESERDNPLKTAKANEGLILGGLAPSFA